MSAPNPSPITANSDLPTALQSAATAFDFTEGQAWLVTNINVSGRPLSTVVPPTFFSAVMESSAVPSSLCEDGSIQLCMWPDLIKGLELGPDDVKGLETSMAGSRALSTALPHLLPDFLFPTLPAAAPSAGAAESTKPAAKSQNAPSA
jgi:hypothetical protein